MESTLTHWQCRYGTEHSPASEIGGTLAKAMLPWQSDGDSRCRRYTERFVWQPQCRIVLRFQRYRLALRSRNALPMTETELKLMAALAIIGLNNRPNQG